MDYLTTFTLDCGAWFNLVDNVTAPCTNGLWDTVYLKTMGHCLPVDYGTLCTCRLWDTVYLWIKGHRVPVFH